MIMRCRTTCIRSAACVWFYLLFLFATVADLSDSDVAVVGDDTEWAALAVTTTPN